MPDATLVPTPAPPNLVTFTVKVGGEALPQTMQLVHAAISFEINKIPYAKLSFRDGDAAEQSFAISEDARFDPGAEVEVSLGYQGEETAVFKGILVKHAIKCRTGKPALVALDCRHKAFAQSLDARCKQFTDQTDSDIISELLADAAGDVESTDVSHQAMMQYRATNWDFVLARAAANGRLVLPQLEAIDVKKPDFAKAAALALAFGSTLEEFEAEVDARHQLAALKAVSWNPANQEATSVDSASPAEPEQGPASADDLASALAREPSDFFADAQMPEQELQALADAALVHSRVSKIRGRCRCQGFAEILPGDTLELEGLGERFNGKAFVAAVTHEVSQGNWRSHIQFGVEPSWFSNDSPRASIPYLPKAQGLHVGIVKQLESDPDGEERILVTLPVTHAEGDGLWARLASTDAGAERGFVWRPEIGDEVVVAFFDNDPRYPVILGSLYSSANAAHLPAADDNHQKGYQSREKLQLLFDDETKEITIQTASGNKLLLTEDQGAIIIEDENGNVTTMNSDGISHESPGDIKITATGDVTIEGANVNLTASAALKAEGSASAEISSGGQTTVKGSVVMIN